MKLTGAGLNLKASSPSSAGDHATIRRRMKTEEVTGRCRSRTTGTSWIDGNSRRLEVRDRKCELAGLQ